MIWYKELVKGFFTHETKELVHRAQNGYCKNCTERIQSFHHRLPNTKPNRKNYPLFLVSIFNCVGLCNSCHDRDISQYKVTAGEAQSYEEFLTNIIKAVRSGKDAI